jgi:hypothetical protein
MRPRNGTILIPEEVNSRKHNGSNKKTSLSRQGTIGGRRNLLKCFKGLILV